MRAGRLALGLALAAMSGVAFGYAFLAGRPAWYAVAGLALAGGVLVTVLDMSGTRRVKLGAEPRREPNLTVPPIGEMLVQRQLISRDDLDQALESQKGRGKLLGQILVDMGVLKPADLAEVLEEQLARREGRFVWLDRRE